MSDLTKFMLKAFVRKVLTALGMLLLTHDMLTGSANDFAAGYVDEIAGGLMLAGSSAWTFVYQKYVKDKVVTALKLPEGSTPNQLAKALGEK